MSQNTGILASQIQRLMLSEADKQRLLEELKTLDEKKMKVMADMIQEHDEEALKLLDEKAEEQLAIKERILKAQPDAKAGTEKDVRDFLKILEDAFRDPEKMAQFLAISDDLFLMKLEDIMVVGALKNQPQYQQEFRRFFQEMRLQKAAVEKKVAKNQKKTMIDEIMTLQEQSKKLDEVIAEAQKVLKK